MMADPTTVDQLTAGGAYPHEDCGETCVRSILCDAGKADTVADIEKWDASHGDWPGDGTGGDVAVSRLVAAGIPAYVWQGDTLAQIQAGLSKALNRWMVAIWSDANGDPQPGSGTGHWILIYGLDSATNNFHCMQPVGGLLKDYSVESIEAAQQHYGVEIARAIASTPSPISAGSNSMWKVKRAALVGGEGYVLDGYGNLHIIGAMPPVNVTGHYWPGWDIARDIALAPDGSGGLILDGFGGLHPFAAKGAAPGPPSGGPYWANWDVAVGLIVRDFGPNPSGYVVDGLGGVHSFGGAPALPSTAGYPIS